MEMDLNKLIIGVGNNSSSFSEKLNGIQSANRSGKRDPEVEKATKNFEGMFLSHLMNEMMKTAGGGLMGKGLSGDIFQGLFVQSISEQLTLGRGLGLSDMIYKYLEKTGIVDDSNKATEE